MPEIHFGILLNVGVMEEGESVLKGVVTGLFDRPVGNALVEIFNRVSVKTLTNAFGEYEFIGIEQASWELYVSHQLYEPYKTTVDVTEDITYTTDISLDVKMLVKAVVIITGVTSLFFGGMKLTRGRKK